MVRDLTYVVLNVTYSLKRWSYIGILLTYTQSETILEMHNVVSVKTKLDKKRKVQCLNG